MGLRRGFKHLQAGLITATYPCNVRILFLSSKNQNYSFKNLRFLNFVQKYILLVHIRTNSAKRF